MIKFDYDNNEADELINEFKCKKCFHLSRTNPLEIPKMEFGNYTTIKHSFKHKCQCGECYVIDIYNGIFDNYGVIHRISSKEKEVFVHEVPFPRYNKDSIFVDTLCSFSRIRTIIDEIENMNNDNKSFIYCLLFLNIISIIDSFVKIYTEPIILCNNALIEKFAVVFKMPKGNTEDKKNKIREFYEKRSFQTVSNQRKLFEDVFNIDVTIDGKILNYVAIRDIIAHRNSITPAGYTHRIKKSQLLEAISVVETYINHLSNSLINYEANLFAEKK